MDGPQAQQGAATKGSVPLESGGGLCASFPAETGFFLRCAVATVLFRYVLIHCDGYISS